MRFNDLDKGVRVKITGGKYRGQEGHIVYWTSIDPAHSGYIDMFKCKVFVRMEDNTQIQILPRWIEPVEITITLEGE